MKKRIKVKWKIILAESIGVIFLINGISRLQKSYYSDIWKALVELDPEKLESFTATELTQFFFVAKMFGVWVFLSCFLILLLVKWKTKLPLKNTFLSFILVFILFPIGFFNIDFINAFFNSIGAIFTKDIGFSFLISGLILTLMGLVIVCFGIKLNKNYAQHHDSQIKDIKRKRENELL